MDFFVRRCGGVEPMNSSLRMRTERSLRSDVEFLERLKTALAFLNLE
jgi:predicted transcriptional regulator of viral defense system